MVTMTGLSGLTSNDVLLGDVRRPGWWLVERADDGLDRVVAGPFGDRTEAAWAATVEGPAGTVGSEYGVRAADGSLSRRPSPEERAWFELLEEQLDRLPLGWDAELPDDHPLATLVVELTAALTDAGLPLHDARAEGPAGGVCLSPELVIGGVVVTWRQHDRASLERSPGTEADTLVQQAMGRAVAEVLSSRSFAVEQLGGSTGIVVRWGA
jgi:hypothetical protein